MGALTTYLSRRWRQPRARSNYRYDLAVLHNPKEAMPPSNPKALQQFVKIGRECGVNVEPVSYTHLDVYKRQVSVCPASTKPPAPSPKVAIKLALSGRSASGSMRTLKPASSSQPASRSMTARLLWSNCGDTLLTEGVAIN